MINPSDVRVGTKLSVGFGVLLIMTAILGVVAFRQATTARAAAEELAHATEKVNAGGDLGMAANLLRASSLSYLLDPTTEADTAYRDQLKAATEQLAIADRVINDPEVHQQLQAVERDLKQFQQTFDAVANLRKGVTSVYETRLDPIGLKANDEIDEAARAAGTGFECAAELNRTRIRVQRYLISQEPSDFDRAVEAAQNCRTLLERAINESAAPAKDHFAAGAELFDQYCDAAQDIFDATESIRVQRQSTLDPLAASISDNCIAINDALTTEADDRSSATQQALATSRTQTSVIAAVAIIFGALSAYFISRGITQPVRTIIERVKDIAQGEGDLTRRLDLDRKDEFGELATWFNTFITRIHDAIKQVAATTDAVNRASTEIAAASEQMAQGLREQSSQTTQVSAAVEELSSTVAEVARKSGEATQAAVSARNDAHEGGTVVASTVSEMNSISSEVGDSAKAVTELGKKSEQIGQIISTINEIADQTNLLALNAAIEAARAGEHGRGFAVVADEVRKLADRTTRATEEVAGSIRDIQTNTGSAVEKIESGVSRVTKGVQLANSAGEALARIVQGSDNVGSMVSSIAAAATEQSAATQEIARSIEAINAASTQAAQGAEQSAQSAAELRTQADQLRPLVNSFKI